MQFDISILRKSDQFTLRLSRLYEQYGYSRFCMNKLEEYSFYVENMNFLQSKNVIVFSDLDGRLMALKPDITMSIVKNLRTEKDETARMYYMENVFRASKETREYREIRQMGIECLGEIFPCTICEILSLAKQSLAVIDERYYLDISHQGFVMGLLDSIGAEYSVKEQLLDCIRKKSAHEIRHIAAGAGVTEKDIRRLETAASLSGSFERVVAQAEEIAEGPEMREALNELKLYFSVLGDGHLRLDFSIASDMGYYNGIVFQGYVKPIPKAVLFGGQYDKLLIRMGKEDKRAIGFAINFDELERYYKREEKNTTDTLILCDEGSDVAEVNRMVCRETEQGKRVLVQSVQPSGTAFEKILDLRKEKGQC